MSVACTYVSPFDVLVYVLLFASIYFRLWSVPILSVVFAALGRHERRGLFVTLLLFIVDRSEAIALCCSFVIRRNYHPALGFV